MKNVKIKTPDTHLVTVYQSSDPIQADLVRDTLDNAGVEAMIDGEYQAGFAGVLPVNVMVRESVADAALAIIREIFPVRDA